MGFNFFLYGTYDVGGACFGRFKNLIKKSETAYVRGSIFKISSGLPLYVAEGGNLVRGSAVELELSDSYWAILDGLNGIFEPQSKKNFLIRQTVDLVLPESAPIKVQTYALNPDKKKLAYTEISEVECLCLGAANAEILSKLTERQRTYLQKLSGAKGRDIVPVDMALYRELMSLELIVDKGRRLALTSLGQEISLFI